VYQLPSALGCPGLARWLDAVGREDHGTAVNSFAPFETVVAVAQLDAVVLQLVGDVRVMDEVTQHPDLLPRMGFRRLLGGADRLDDPVAITPRRDLEDVHRFESTRPFRARTDRSGYEKVTGSRPPAHASRAFSATRAFEAVVREAAVSVLAAPAGPGSREPARRAVAVAAGGAGRGVVGGAGR